MQHEVSQILLPNFLPKIYQWCLHKPRGLLDVTRQTWSTGKRLKMSTNKYMEKLNEKLEMVRKIARENIAHAQEQMKRQYEKTAKKRE